MKHMIKKQDGYILAYVLVVVMVVSLIAVAACTTAVRNHKAQQEALKYTQDKYVAEGVVERFVAEFEAAAIVVAENITSGSAGEIENDIRTKLNSIFGDENPEPVDGIVDGILSEGYNINADGKVESLTLYTYKDQNGDIVTDYNRGYFPANAEISAKKGTVQVDADLSLIFTAEIKSDGEDVWQITGVSFEYTSYKVSTVSEGGGA